MRTCLLIESDFESVNLKNESCQVFGLPAILVAQEHGLTINLLFLQHTHKE